MIKQQVRVTNKLFFMTLVGHYIISSLILILVQISYQQGVFKFKDINLISKAHNNNKLRSGRCCGSTILGFDTSNNCNIECKIVFTICLFKFVDKDKKYKTCLIGVESTTPLATGVKNMDVQFSKTFGVSFTTFFYYLCRTLKCTETSMLERF